MSDAAGLRASHLAAWTYTRIADDHPLKAELRSDYLAALARHQQIKMEFASLLRAWAAAGIEAMVYKGFYLAEFVYPVPGARYHGDVDVLLRFEETVRALEVARTAGWSERANSAETGRPWHQDAFSVYRKDGAAQVDGHRSLVRQSLRWHGGPRRISDAIWRASVPTAWAGAVVRVPSLVDAFLVGLVLDRCIGDGWRGFKAHDAIDAGVLLERGVTLDAARARAAELGIRRSLEQALRCYDPVRGVLTAPSLARRLRYRFVSLVEAGAIRLPEWWQRARRGPGLAWGILRVLPLIRRVRRVLATQRDVREVLRAVTPAAGGGQRSSSVERRRVVRAIKWAFRLLRLGPEEGDCLPRSLTIYAALRARGWPAVFVSGVRRHEGEIQGHAWVELDGAVLPELIGQGPLPQYTGNFRYPA